MDPQKTTCLCPAVPTPARLRANDPGPRLSGLQPNPSLTRMRTRTRPANPGPPANNKKVGARVHLHGDAAERAAARRLQFTFILLSDPQPLPAVDPDAGGEAAELEAEGCRGTLYRASSCEVRTRQTRRATLAG